MDPTVFLFYQLYEVRWSSFSSSFFCSKPPHQSVLSLFFCLSLSVPLLSPTSHLSCFCVISVSFVLFFFLPADVSPRRSILNVSRSVWKQANVASDLWEKLTARCVDRHRSGWIMSSSRTWTQLGLTRLNCLGFMIKLHGYCVRSVSNPPVSGKPGNSNFLF